MKRKVFLVKLSSNIFFELVVAVAIFTGEDALPYCYEKNQIIHVKKNLMLMN
jgi:hypothetical protein